MKNNAETRIKLLIIISAMVLSFFHANGIALNLVRCS